MISASALHRIAKCPASAVLPQSHEETAAGERGTAIHKFREDCFRIGRAKALELVPGNYRATCEALQMSVLEHLDATQYAFEVAFAYNPATDTARELGRGQGRKY